MKYLRSFKFGNNDSQVGIFTMKIRVEQKVFIYFSFKEIFATFGIVRDIRIVTHKSGKSKGCAYVEFENDDDAAVAVKASEDLILLGLFCRCFCICLYMYLCIRSDSIFHCSGVAINC